MVASYGRTRSDSAFRQTAPTTNHRLRRELVRVASALLLQVRGRPKEKRCPRGRVGDDAEAASGRRQSTAALGFTRSRTPRSRDTPPCPAVGAWWRGSLLARRNRVARGAARSKLGPDDRWAPADRPPTAPDGPSAAIASPGRPQCRLVVPRSRAIARVVSPSAEWSSGVRFTDLNTAYEPGDRCDE